MKKLIVLVAAVLVALTCPGSGPGEEQKDLKEMMQRKLKFAQKVLEGVAIKDFDLIVTNADELVQVSKEAQWRVLKTPEYDRFSNDFRRNAELLIRQAKDRNLDGAALAYVDLTLNCVKCHKYVREVRMTRLDR
jgi:hypothetical protein